MHLVGADLHFERLPVRTHHRRVQRLVEVGPRDGDEVFNAAGDGPPLIMDHAQRGVAVFHRVGDDPQGHQIVHFVHRDLLAAQLLEYRIGPFEASIDARRNRLVPQCCLHFLADLHQEFFVGVAPRLDRAENFLVGVGLQVLECQVLQFPADFPHAQAMRDGRVDFDGFARNPLPPLGAEVSQGPHIVDAVGQLHQDDADILHHGQQHFAEALRLPVLGREEIQLAQLGDAVHAARHVFAEFLAHLFPGDAGVFHHVVKQSRLHGDDIHAHVRQDMGHHEWVHHVRLAGTAALSLVVFQGEAESFFQGRQVVFRAVLADLGFELGIQLFHRVEGRLGWQNFRKTDGVGSHCTLDCSKSGSLGRPASAV